MENFCIAWSVFVPLVALLSDHINVMWLVAALIPLWTHVYLQFFDFSQMRALAALSEPILGVVNENCGSGMAVETWKRLIRNNTGSFMTPNARHIGIAKWSKIVCVGGDGTIHRVCQEMARLGANAPALLVVPVGSSNGIAASLGILSILDATNPHLRVIDVPLMVVKNQNRELFGVMSVGWGFIADYDFYAENGLRWLGKLRDVVVPAMLLAQHRTYSGEVLLHLHESDSQFQSCGGRLFVSTQSPTILINSNDFRMVHVVKMSHITQDVCMYEDIKPEEDILYVFIIRQPVTRLRAACLFKDMVGFRHADCVEMYACTGVQILPTSGHMCVDGEDIPCEPITISTGGPRVRMFAK